MNVGDIYDAEIPFDESPGSKIRPVIICHIFDDGNLLLAESRGKPHPHLELLGILDMERMPYKNRKRRGVSQFYMENIRERPASVLRKNGFIKALLTAEFEQIVGTILREFDL